MAAKKVSHIGIAVPDLQKAADFLITAFQLDPKTTRPELNVKNLFLDVAGFSVQLVEDEGRLGGAPFGRLDHLAIEVDDIDETAELLQAAGAELAWPEPLVTGKARSQFTTEEGGIGVVFQLSDRLAEERGGPQFTPDALAALAKK